MATRGKSSRWRRVESQELASSDEEPMDKVKEVQMAIEQSKHQVNRAIEKTLARGDKLDDLEDKAEGLQQEAQIFTRNARAVRRRMCWQNCKAQLVLIVVVLIVIMLVYFVFIHPMVVNNNK